MSLASADGTVVGAEWLDGLGRVLVVAPHPDDESLGCGGLIACLRERGRRVFVVLVSDGTMSHPRSQRFPTSRRHALRLVEMREAIAELGVEFGALVELGCHDGAVPTRGEAGFEAAVCRLEAALRWSDAATVVAPWRRDAHADHRASHAIATAALACRHPPPRLLEYGVWLEERGDAGDLPRPGEADVWRVDVSGVVEKKRRAIARHRSQCGEVIDDDPTGFVLSPAMRERCCAGVERYFEARR